MYRLHFAPLTVNQKSSIPFTSASLVLGLTSLLKYSYKKIVVLKALFETIKMIYLIAHYLLGPQHFGPRIMGYSLGVFSQNGPIFNFLN